MRILFLNPISGVAGDMLTAALLDLGADTPEFWEQLRSLPLPASTWTVGMESVTSRGLAAKRFSVTWEEGAHVHGRHLAQIKEIISGSKLPLAVQAMAAQAFDHLAEAEARVHATTPEKVHFHEVGAVDAIADICGACLALEMLRVDSVVCGPIAIGSGWVTCAHGQMPVPVPAVAELLRGVPVFSGPVATELTTPTGAALLKTMTRRFDAMPAARLMRTGYGAGTREFAEAPNVIQALLLETSGSPGCEVVSVIECSLDDMTGEYLGYLIAELMAAGAMDVAVLPCTMKKGRPGHILQILAFPADEVRLTELVFRESTTLGVRIHPCRRQILDRETISVKTDFGLIRIKRAWHPETGSELNISPEFEDCAAAARQYGVPLATVYAAVLAAGLVNL